ncbi:MAG: 3-coathanger stack domain-containing protein [Bacteroidota bacterium]
MIGNTATTTPVSNKFSFDQHGRTTDVEKVNHLGATETFNNEYDFADNLLISPHQHQAHGHSVTLKNRTTIDNQGRVIGRFHQYGNEPEQALCALEYTAKDELKTKFLGGNATSHLQKVDYVYLANGFLKSMNEVMSADDLFQFTLNYDQQVVGLSGAGQKNGNITSLQWQVKGGPSQIYGYHYDDLDRLIEARYNLNSNAYGATYGYDKRGNFTSITRRGVYSNGTNFLPQSIDNMNFTPITGTNKIQTITDSAPCPDNKVIHQALDNTEMHAVATELQADNVVNENAAITYQAGTEITLKAGFHAKAGTNFTAKIADCPQSGFETDGFVERSSSSYQYDADGNQTRDPNKGITNQYNYFNLAYKTTFDNGNVLEWLYLGDGTKVQKVAKRGGVAVLTQDYLENIEYQNDTLDGIYLEDAKLTFNGGAFDKYAFYIKDYIANSRVLFADDGTGQAEIVQNQDFYPYGYQLKGNYTQNLSSTDKYQFNGFERTTDFGLGIDIAPVRSYDPTTGRWWQVDPKAELFAGYTPYKFGMNNPILFNDPNGDCETCKEFIGAAAAYFAGVGNSIASNLLGGAPGTRNNPSDFGAYAGYAAAGQTAGDVLSVAIGAAEQTAGGVGIVTGIIAAPETAGLSLGLSAAGTALATHGTIVTHSAIDNLLNDDGVVQANDNQGSGKGRGKNKRKPDPEATGDHSVYNERGNTTFEQNPRNPKGFDEVKRTDVEGSPHRNRDGTKVETPHVHTKGKKDVDPAVKGKDY